jgi:hypothetical protein
MSDDRETIWGHLHEALPNRWTVGRASFDPSRHGWSISAIGPHPGRGIIPVGVRGFGADELAAVRDLDGRLRGEDREGPPRRDMLRARLRLAYIEGAEGWARQELGRALEHDEVERIIRRFPSDQAGSTPSDA